MARKLFGGLQCEPKKARSSVEQYFYLLLVMSIEDCLKRPDCAQIKGSD